MDRAYPFLLAGALGCAALIAADCGDGGMGACGDGVKGDDEQCDNGGQNGQPGSNCSADCQLVSVDVSSLQVFYYRLMNEAMGFNGASCLDLGVDKAHVVLDGPTPKDVTWPCSMNSDTYQVDPGTYQATITLLDKDGNALTKPVKSAMTDVPLPGMKTLTINFKQTDFLKQDYVGRLDFNPSWGVDGKGCSMANPPVVTEGVRLSPKGGSPVAGMTTAGHKLDGTFSACFEKGGAASYESVDGLTWGHYDLVLSGRVNGGALGYCKKFDVFVGPGSTNATYQLTAASAPADGGACP